MLHPDDIKQVAFKQKHSADGLLEKYISQVLIYLTNFRTVHCFDCDLRIKCLGYDVVSYAGSGWYGP